MTEIIIKPNAGWLDRRIFKEIWEYRDLLFFLAQRDLSVRYKQTILGALWAIIQPFLMMIVFSVVFGRFMGVPSDNQAYPVWVYAGLLPWQLFASAMGTSAQSLVNNQQLISKVYFPRLIIPLASILPPIVDFFIAFLVLLGMMLFYHVTLTWRVLLLLPFLLIIQLLALGIGLWLSALNVQYRDFRYIIPFLTQIWFYATPVAYPSSIFADSILQFLIFLNPMAGVIEAFRWIILGTAFVPDIYMFFSLALIFIILVSGLIYFRRMEMIFADVI